MCVCVGANSALQELPTMKTRCKRADMRFPIGKLVDFPALNACAYYIMCVYLIICSTLRRLDFYIICFIYSRQLRISCFSRTKQTPHALLFLYLLPLYYYYIPNTNRVHVYNYTSCYLITPLSARVSLPQPTVRYNAVFFTTTKY